MISLEVNISPSYYWCYWECSPFSMLWRFIESLWVNRNPLSMFIKQRLLIPRMIHLRYNVILRQLTYYGLLGSSRRCSSHKSVLLVASPNRHALSLLRPRKHPLRFLTKNKLKRKVENVPDLQCNCKLPLALFRSTGLNVTPRQRRQKCFVPFRMPNSIPKRRN